MISDEQIKEFQEIYKKELGIEISREEAYERAAKLIRLIKLIYKPLTKSEFVKIYELLRDKRGL